jgi:hypothetical protein
MTHFFKRILRWLGLLDGPHPPADPYARKPAHLVPSPKGRSGAVAVAEPDE